MKTSESTINYVTSLRSVFLVCLHTFIKEAIVFYIKIFTPPIQLFIMNIWSWGKRNWFLTFFPLSYTTNRSQKKHVSCFTQLKLSFVIRMYILLFNKKNDYFYFNGQRSVVHWKTCNTVCVEAPCLPVQILTAEFWPCFPGSPIEKHGVEWQSTQPN